MSLLPPAAAGLAIAARYLLAAVFAVAAYGKVRRARGFGNFVTTVRKLTGLAPERARRVAGAVVAAEIVTACLLAVPPALPGAPAGPLLAAGLLALFTAAALRAVRAGVFTECGCFGRYGSVMGYPLIVRNVLLLAAAPPAVLVTPSVPWPALAVPAVAGSAVALVYVRFYDDAARAVLVRLVGRPRTRPDEEAGR
ncbi:MauE/DoxX family redox-associated membrane protein [Spirillospora sp. NPDC029432]|uniref:MauE/DoxX family redox-associated membrane protein n=1 Tax=Spirillospora sp. NPDC029432 TaxID=3154599 RepID=UPI003453B0B6